MVTSPHYAFSGRLPSALRDFGSTCGSLFVLDVAHVPVGYGQWSALWLLGLDGTWPSSGEIDFFETVHMTTNNQVTLHTDAGCTQSDVTGAQTGLTIQTNCNSTDNSGCTVQETKSGSYGAQFAANGGGVWATQIDVRILTIL